MTRRQPVLALFSMMLAAVLLLQAFPAEAFKPFTHNLTGDQALKDVTADGKVTISGREYPVRPEIVSALRTWPEFYNAGVVGPDGFPDLTYGQQVIHSNRTGLWLRHMYDSAWAIQSNPSYSSQERSQVLAFAYGYLTHAAGDMWAHTLVNDFSGGVFPGVSEIEETLRRGDASLAKIALRHIVLEGYIGDATPGYDGNPDPLNVGGDISDDSTPGVAFNAPNRFIYEAMINPAARTPSGCGNGQDDDGDNVKDDGCPGSQYMVGEAEPLRGPSINYFLDLQAEIEIERAKRADLAGFTNCLGDSWGCEPLVVTIPVHTVRGLYNDLRVTHWTCTEPDGFWPWQKCITDPTDTGIIDRAIRDYLTAWVADIVEGLRHWGELNVAVTKGLFDPHTRRIAQNALCSNRGADTFENLVRRKCEEEVGTTDAVFYAVEHTYGNESFIDRYMLSMLGAPDAVGEVRKYITEVASLLQPLFDEFGLAVNPLQVPLAELEELAKDKIKEIIEERIGIDVEALAQFESSPHQWMCGNDGSGRSVSLTGGVTIRPSGLFSPAEHARLDAILGLPGDHHEIKTGIPQDCGPLRETAATSAELFAPLQNTITTAKLLLFDGKQLNAMLGDLLVHAGVLKNGTVVQTYPANESNIMFSGFSQIDSRATERVSWLRSIDSDHAWRRDGLPRFCNTGERECALDKQRNWQHNGGNGNFPVWESCLLRPGFRLLFQDWENPSDFPDLGDAPYNDAHDPLPPRSRLLVNGIETSGPSIRIGTGDLMSLSVEDSVFATGVLKLRYRLYQESAPAPAGWNALPVGGVVSVPRGASDGRWTLEFHAEDPCHTFAEDRDWDDVRPSDQLAPEPVHVQSLLLQGFDQREYIVSLPLVMRP